MKSNLCSFCQRPKANYTCEMCQSTLCKACAQFLNEDSFSFLEKIPQELSFTTYCPPCYDTNVAAPLADYEAVKEKAKDVVVFFKEQGQATRLMRRKEHPVSVNDRR
jgi:thiol-disulfide isomerase/thioredoxin